MLRRLVPATVAVALLAAAPAAHAAQLTTDRSCYLPNMGMAIQGTGFTPGGELNLSGPGTTVLTGNADASGAFSATLNTPPAAVVGATGTTPGDLKLSATESATGGFATTTVKVVQFAFGTDQGVKSPKAQRTWRFSGFLIKPGKPIYGHFRFGGKTMSNFRFGVPKAPCGTLTKHAPGIPGRIVRAGSWTIQIDQNKTFKASEKLALKTTTTIFRVFR